MISISKVMNSNTFLFLLVEINVCFPDGAISQSSVILTFSTIHSVCLLYLKASLFNAGGKPQGLSVSGNIHPLLTSISASDLINSLESVNKKSILKS